jgi:hypothetical protein
MLDQGVQYPIFDGNEFDPQFAIALKQFIIKNLPRRSSSGFASVPANSTHYAIAHGLGATPTFISISDFPAISGGVVWDVGVSTTSPAADATNIYVDTTATGAPRNFYWAAGID